MRYSPVFTLLMFFIPVMILTARNPDLFYGFTNVFALRDERIIYLPLSHNIALRFNQVPGKGFYQNPAIRVFSPVPSSLNVQGRNVWRFTSALMIS
jgi:hypothetical protein